jgi:hydroxybutyrate-dimer hydrolase
MKIFSRLAAFLVVPLAGCAATNEPSPMTAQLPIDPLASVRVTEHRNDDDLLTAGLGLAGLRAMLPPAFANPEQPTAAESRRRAIWSNWRGIADLMPGGGYGEFYGETGPVPGREFSTLLRLDGARHPFRALLQLPDAFDAQRPCLIVAAASGSRGIYGAISLASAWGLPRGCAVVHTDKGAGSGWFDHASATGVQLDGTPGARDDMLEFEPGTEVDGRPLVAIKHLHSGDNPEADWGRHVEQAARFGLEMLSEANPGQPDYTPENTRIIAVGLSNGGGAVLRAAEIADGWLDGVVAVAANIHPGQGGRPLFDYATEAALYLPCALLDGRFDSEPNARPGGIKPEPWRQRCASLAAAGRLHSGSEAERIVESLERLTASGWSLSALASAGVSQSFDLWRAVGAGYASAYLRSHAGAMPCGYGYALLDENGVPRAASATERAAWWSENSGIPPAGTVTLIDAFATGPDPHLSGLLCVRDLWEGEGSESVALRKAVAATRAGLPPRSLPMLLIHGADDGLIPEPHSTGAYVAWLRENGRAPHYWKVAPAQHFDAFLAFPQFGGRYLPLMPYAYRALDAMWEHLETGAPLPPSRSITGRPRALSGQGLEPLSADHLGLD